MTGRQSLDLIEEGRSMKWSYEVKHGPDGEENYAWVLKGREMVATMRTHLAKEICAGMNAALSAAQAQPVAIKPLEWELINGWWFGPTAEGQNYIVRASSATNFKGQWLWGLGVDKYELAPSLEAAKAAAQQDYEARIRSALVPPAVPGEVERENAKLVELIKTRFLGVHPDELDCYLEYDDWTRIIAALSVPLPEIEGGDKGDGWRPIDTAPIGAKGTSWMMLAYGPEGDQSVSVGMKFHDKYYAASTFYVGGPHDSRQFRFQEHEVFPTHWKHLPAAPSASIEGETKP